MVLEIGLKFIYLAHRKAMCLADYKSDISCGGYDHLFNLDDFDKTSYALKVLNEEFESAMIRANKRLLADGYGEGDSCKPSIEKDGIEAVE